MKAWAEGHDGTSPTYVERLWPRWWTWLAIPALVSPLAVAYGAAYGSPAGTAILVAGTALGWLWLAAATPVIRVDERVFRAGRARLPLSYAGEATALGAAETREAARTGDARSYVLLRAWASPQAVRVDVLDAADPHPYWLVSTRRPSDLVRALAEAPRHGSASGRAE